MRRPGLALACALLAGGAPAAAAGSGGEGGSPAAPAQSAAVRRDDKLAKVRERRRALEAELERLRQQERSLLGEVERLELEVRLRGEQLREVQLELSRTNEELDRTVRRLAAVERSIAAARPALAARARSLYKLGELSYLRLLLSVDRPSDMFRGYRFVTALARRDNERFAAFRADLEAQAAARAQLEQRTQEALALRAGVERARRGLEAERQRKTSLLTRIVEKKETRALYLQELEEAEARLTQLVEGLGEGEVAIPVSAFRGNLPWPVAGRVRVPFGKRKHPRFDTYTLSNGIEIDAPIDTPVRAVHEGIVAFADHFRGYGLMVILDHGNKHHTLYGHLGEASVQLGQKVEEGATIATVGSGLEGPGLYFEVRFQGRPEDPQDWLREAKDKP